MANLYTPLNASKKQIRLLHLNQSDDRCQPISATISQHALDRAPPYQALSYVWGNPQNTESITVNGHAAEATTNLVALLRELRHQSFQRSGTKSCLDVHHENIMGIWVDAICIDQSNVAERNEQVLLMEQIYSRAEMTVGWLGESSEDSSLAMRSLQDLGDLLVGKRAGLSQPVRWCDLPQHFIVKDIDQAPFSAIWQSVERLLVRDYWHRAWTFQEMVIPENALLMCGTDTCYLVTMVLAGCWLWDNLTGECPDEMDPAIWTHIAQIRYYMKEFYSIGRAHFQYHGRPGNDTAHDCISWPHTDYDWDMIINTRGKKATIAHDAIYAFLAVSRLPIQPDYEQPLHELYLRVARIGVQCKRLEILLCCSVRTEDHLPSVLVPSWVPEWLPESQGCTGAFLGKFLQIYAANRRVSTSECAAVNDEGCLNLDGKFCDRVSFVGCPSVPFGISDQVQDILRHYTSAEKYVTGIPLLQAVLRTLLCDQDGRGVRLHKTARRNHETFSTLITLALVGELQPDQSKGTTHMPNSLLGMPISKEFGRSYAKAVLDDDDDEFIGRTPREVLDPFIRGLIARNGEEDELAQHLSSMTHVTRLFVTEQGFLGNGPCDIQNGDWVVVSPHSRLPLALRKRASIYQCIGPCFVLGAMDGEALDNERECEKVLIG